MKISKIWKELIFKYKERAWGLNVSTSNLSLLDYGSFSHIYTIQIITFTGITEANFGILNFTIWYFSLSTVFLKTKVNRAFIIQGWRRYGIVSFAEIDHSRTTGFLTNIGHFFSEFYTVHLDIYLILFPGKLNKKYLHAFSESFELNKKEPDLFVATINLYCRDPVIIQTLEVKCK